MFSGFEGQSKGISVYISNTTIEGSLNKGKNVSTLGSTSTQSGGYSKFPTSEVLQFLHLSKVEHVMTICKVKLFEAGMYGVFSYFYFPTLNTFTATPTSAVRIIINIIKYV